MTGGLEVLFGLRAGDPASRAGRGDVPLDAVVSAAKCRVVAREWHGLHGSAEIAGVAGWESTTGRKHACGPG